MALEGIDALFLPAAERARLRASVRARPRAPARCAGGAGAGALVAPVPGGALGRFPSTLPELVAAGTDAVAWLAPSGAPFPPGFLYNSPGDMAHLTSRSGYPALVERLNRFPQGAPPSDLLYKILALLCDEREAALVAQLPIPPFPVAEAARRWKMGEAEAARVLDALASRAVLLDAEARAGRRTYVLPPPMAGFFEFAMMRRARRSRPEGALRALLPVPQRRGRLRPRPLRHRRDPARAGLRRRDGAARGAFARGAWTTSAPARWWPPPRTAPSASATAATRCSTSTAPARRRWRSA